MIILVMGVSGSGKTTVGMMLAEAIRCRFLEGDSPHFKENIGKMRHAIPLTDSDRVLVADGHLCSYSEVFQAWEESCRRMLRSEAAVLGISLRRDSHHLGLSERLSRTHSFAHEASGEALQEGGLAPGQFDALEEPSDVIVIDISPPPSAIVAQVLA
jgi:gluconokinase